MTARKASCAIVGAGDFIGSAIARKFAAEGYAVFAGRRTAEKLEPLKAEIESAGGFCAARRLDARKEDEVVNFLAEADAFAPLEIVIVNPGANVNFPILETTERVFFKVWEMACKAGFLTGREAARIMLRHGRGSIFFTGATASLRGGSGYAAFASAKAGLRMVAQAMAREANVELGLEDFTRIGARVPVLADVKPSGKYLMAELIAIGGIQPLMKSSGHRAGASR